MKTWFITGGTPGGFGMAYAEAALADGDRVAVTARRPEELHPWARQYGDRVLVLTADVTDPKAVEQAVRAAEEHSGGIDVLVNNAGRGWFGSIEGMADVEVRRMFELNFFAVLSVIRAVLPGMRARGSGWIINMSSVAGLRGIEGFGYYNASKFALEAVTEVLRAEVAPLGIQVMAVEPGAFRTRAYAGFADEAVEETIAAYLPMLEKVRTAKIDQDGKQPGDPRRGVRAVIAAMAQDPPPHRLVLGSDGFDAVVTTLENTLNDIRACEALSRGADFSAGDPHLRAELVAGHLRRLEAELDRTRAAVVSLRQLLQPDAAALDVELRSVPARTVVAISSKVRIEDSLTWFDAAMDELDAAFPPAERTGPPGGRYANDLFTDGVGVLTVFRPVRSPRGDGRIEVVEFPATDLAVTVHAGSHDDIDVSYGRLGDWVVSHALGIDGPVHETYLAGPRDTGDARRWRTEIGWPVFRLTPG